MCHKSSSIKIASTALKSVQQDLMLIDSDLQEVHKVNYIQISDLLVDVEDTSKLSSDLVARMEESWQNR